MRAPVAGPRDRLLDERAPDAAPPPLGVDGDRDDPRGRVATPVVVLHDRRGGLVAEHLRLRPEAGRDDVVEGEALVGERAPEQRVERSGPTLTRRRAGGRAARGTRSGSRRARSTRSANDGSWHSSAWSSTRPDQSGWDARSSSVSTAGWKYTSVTPGRRSNSARSTSRREPDARGVHEVVGEHDALVRRELRGTGSRPTRSPLAPAMRSGSPKSTASSRYTSKKSARSCSVPMWLSRWLTSKPQRIARSTWARHSRRTSSRSAWSQVSGTVRGNPPSPSRRLGAWVTGPQRYRSHSAFRVRCTPTSSPRYSRGGVARPRARDHQRRAGREALPERVVHRDVGRAGGAEVVAVDDEELRVGRVTEALGQGGGVGHGRQATRTWR